MNANRQNLNNVNARQVDDFRFNTDLLTNEADRQRAQRTFPDVYFALYHKELVDAFLKVDPVANAAKKSSRRLGTWAVVLVGFALLLAVSEPLFSLYRLLPQIVAGLSGLSALCGIVGAIIGAFGVLHTRQKRLWLENRLRTEAMRNFHFRTMLQLSPLLLAGREDEYNKERARQWDLFQEVLDQPRFQLKKIVDEEENEASAPVKLPSLSEVSPDPTIAAQWTDAYRRLRIQHQINYATFKLSKDDAILSKFPRRQAAVFASVAGLCVAGLILTHLGVVGDIVYGFLTEAHATPPQAGAGESVANANEAVLSWLHVSGLWLAIVALALRTLQEGLEPGREVERYRHYRSSLHSLQRRFEDMQADVKQVLPVAAGSENESTNEMKNFLRAGSEARFVM